MSTYWQEEYKREVEEREAKELAERIRQAYNPPSGSAMSWSGGDWLWFGGPRKSNYKRDFAQLEAKGQLVALRKDSA